MVSQKTSKYQSVAKKHKVLLLYTPYNTTDLCAVTDCGLGQLVKSGMVKKYAADLEQNLELWSEGKVSASERRVKFTLWLGDVWDDISENYQETITKAFQRCGMLNAKDGSENQLIKIPRVENYSIGQPGDSQSVLCAYCWKGKTPSMLRCNKRKKSKKGKAKKNIKKKSCKPNKSKDNSNNIDENAIKFVSCAVCTRNIHEECGKPDKYIQFVCKYCVIDLNSVECSMQNQFKKTDEVCNVKVDKNGKLIETEENNEFEALEEPNASDIEEEIDTNDDTLENIIEPDNDQNESDIEIVVNDDNNSNSNSTNNNNEGKNYNMNNQNNSGNIAVTNDNNGHNSKNKNTNNENSGNSNENSNGNNNTNNNKNNNNISKRQTDKRKGTNPSVNDHDSDIMMHTNKSGNDDSNKGNEKQEGDESESDEESEESTETVIDFDRIPGAFTNGVFNEEIYRLYMDNQVIRDMLEYAFDTNGCTLPYVERLLTSDQENFTNQQAKDLSALNKWFSESETVSYVEPRCSVMTRVGVQWQQCNGELFQLCSGIHRNRDNDGTHGQCGNHSHPNFERFCKYQPALCTERGCLLAAVKICRLHHIGNVRSHGKCLAHKNKHCSIRDN